LVETREITQGLFDALGMRLSQGRPFDPRERETGGVAVVNEAFLGALLGAATPIGRRFTPAGGEEAFTIIGVVSDVRDGGPEEPPLPTAYFPFGAGPWGAFWPYLVAAVRVQGNPLRVLPTIRERIAELDPDVPFADITSLAAIATDKLGEQRRTATFLFSLFAALALLLGAGGVFSVMAFTVTQRTQEMGLRQALGASGGEILRHVVGQGVVLAAVGIAVGLLGTVTLGRTLSGLLYEVDPLDPVILGGVSALLGAVAVLACYLPARRAASVEPTVALRHD
jgi:hypothetical protein